MQIYNVHIHREDRKGGMSRHPAGRILVEDGQVHHLEDYYGLIHEVLPEGPLDENTAQRLRQMRHGSYMHAVPAQHDFKAPDPEQEPVRKPSSEFEYMHDASGAPRTIQFFDGVPYMDGTPVSSTDLKFMLQRARTGASTIRYKSSGGIEQTVAKMEKALSPLRKQQSMDDKPPMELEDALRLVGDASEGQPVDPEAHKHAVRSIRHHSYIDPMTYQVGGTALGNQRAWNAFKAKNRNDGVYISMDGNDFKSVNDKFGHDVGNNAIKLFGKALRESMDETVGSHQSKLFHAQGESAHPSDAARGVFRAGGDEFTAWVPSHEHAAMFARALRRKLEEMPPIQGTHRLSMSLGFGPSFEHADAALYEAKKQKYTPETQHLPEKQRMRAFEPGQVPTLAHSMHPGHEGPVPLDHNLSPPHIARPEGFTGEMLKPSDPSAPTTPPTAPTTPTVAAPQLETKKP